MMAPTEYDWLVCLIEVDEPDELGGVVLPCHEWGATFHEYMGTCTPVPRESAA